MRVGILVVLKYFNFLILIGQNHLAINGHKSTFIYLLTISFAIPLNFIGTRNMIYISPRETGVMGRREVNWW